jgi:hypothetical protein
MRVRSGTTMSSRIAHAEADETGLPPVDTLARQVDRISSIASSRGGRAAKRCHRPHRRSLRQAAMTSSPAGKSISDPVTIQLVENS